MAKARPSTGKSLGEVLRTDEALLYASKQNGSRLPVGVRPCGGVQ
jgi:hypothetical protein